MKGKFTVLTEAVQVKIKQLIVDGVLGGETRSETFDKIVVLVKKYARQTPQELRKDFVRVIMHNAVKGYDEFKRKTVTIVQNSGITILLLGALLRGEKSGKPIAEQVIDVQRNYERRLNDGVKEDYTEYIFPDRIDVEDVRKKVKAEIRRLSDDGDGSGLRNRAEMYVRHEAQQASIEEMRASGVRLVWASTHVDCSTRCAPWQGKLYSLDGTYGEINGTSYQPLENAVNVYVTTKAGKVWKNGLLGFNCRHRLVPYNEHQAPPKAFTADEMARRRALNERQREIEREIRKQKAQAWEIINQDRETSQRLFASAKRNEEAYRAFCRKHNLVALPYRTQVMVEEMQQFR